MQATWKGFRITATYQGDKQAPWSDERHDNWNNHRVTVSYNGKRTSFEFWASIANPVIRKPSEVLAAFEAFVTDALSGNQDFEEFCSEFGYDTDSRKAEQTWKACQRATKKLERIYPGDIYELANKLQEVIND